MARTKQSQEARSNAEVLKNLVKDQLQFQPEEQLQFQPEDQLQQQNTDKTDDQIFICDANGCESVQSTNLIGDLLFTEYYSDPDE